MSKIKAMMKENEAFTSYMERVDNPQTIKQISLSPPFYRHVEFQIRQRDSLLGVNPHFGDQKCIVSYALWNGDTVPVVEDPTQPRHWEIIRKKEEEVPKPRLVSIRELSKPIETLVWETRFTRTLFGLPHGNEEEANEYAKRTMLPMLMTEAQKYIEEAPLNQQDYVISPLELTKREEISENDLFKPEMLRNPYPRREIIGAVNVYRKMKVNKVEVFADKE